MQAWGMAERPARAVGSHHRRTNDLRKDALAEVLFLADTVDHTVPTRCRTNAEWCAAGLLS
jgi:hypothetical protein